MMQLMIRTLAPGDAGPRVTSLQGAAPAMEVAGLSEVALMFGPDVLARCERIGDDLVLVLDSGQRVTLGGFFADADARPQLQLADADGESAILDFADDTPGALQPLLSDSPANAAPALGGQPAAPTGTVPTSAQTPLAQAEDGEGGGSLPMLLYGGLAVAGQAAFFAAGSIKGGGPKITLETPITDDGIVNAEEDGALTLSGTVKGVDAGRTVTVTFVDSAGKAATAQGSVRGDGTWLVTDANVAGLKDGEVSISVEVVDEDGDSAIATGTLTLDSDPDNLPSVTITMPIAGDGKVNDSEDNDLTIAGTSKNVEQGQTLTVTFTDANGETVTATTTVDADGDWSVAGVDISELMDGTVTIKAEAEDTSGNPASASKSVTLDSDPDDLPTLSITTPITADNVVTDSEDNTLVVAGTSTNVERGQAVTLVFSDGDSETADITVIAAVGTDGSWRTSSINISALVDGTVTITASVIDASGNPASAETSFTLDSDPAASPTAAAGVLSEPAGILGAIVFDDPEAVLDDAMFDTFRAADAGTPASMAAGDGEPLISHAVLPPPDTWIDPPSPVLG